MDLSEIHFADGSQFPNDTTPVIESDGTVTFLKTICGQQQYWGALTGHHAYIAARNLKAGKPWFSASPKYPISRQNAAFILANADTIIRRYEGSQYSGYQPNKD